MAGKNPAPNNAPPPLPRPRLDLREENLNWTIISLALPAIVANVMFTAVFVVDTMIVGHLNNAAALAATTLAGTTVWLVDAPMQALAIASGSLVSRCWGGQDFAAARRYTAHTISFALLFGGAVALLVLPIAPLIIRLLGAERDVIVLAAPYLRIVILSCTLGGAMMVATGSIRAIGDTVTPMVLTGIMNVINIIASISLAFGYGPWPAMGLLGVAWGTVIARTAGGVLALGVLVTRSKGIGLSGGDFVHIRTEALLRIWRLAYPAVFERALGSAAHFVFVMIVALLGTASLAANAIAIQIEALAFMPALGLGVAAATVAGQAIGAGQTHIAELSIKRSLFWSNVWMGTTGVLFVVFGPFLATLFTRTPDVVPMAGLAVQIAALELIPLAFAIVLGSALRSAGDTRSPLYVTFICIVFCRLGVTYLFGITFAWGLAGVWLATAVDWTARAAGLWWIFRVGVWKSIHQKEKAMYAPR